jgi:hypothetical protein
MILCTLIEHQHESEVMLKMLMNCTVIFRTPIPVIPVAYIPI